MDLELLLNQIGSIFEKDQGVQEDYSLQAALSAKVCKVQFEDCGALANDSSCPRPRRVKTQGLLVGSRRQILRNTPSLCLT